MIKNYNTKLDWLIKNQKYICSICNDYLNRRDINHFMIDLHHRLRNTQGNRKKYPLFMDSILNLEAVHHGCHINHHGKCGKMSLLQAELAEKYLRENEAIARFANNPWNNEINDLIIWEEIEIYCNSKIYML